MNKTISFDEDFFFYFVLPPIIFTQGYNMKRKNFFQNMSYISLFGILGTIISFLINASCASFLTNHGLVYDQKQRNVVLSAQDILMLGSVLSASDTVAAISIITEEESPKIFSILLGEGVMNDAVSIILFHSATNLQVNSLQASDVAWFILEFFYDMVASIAIGVCFGLMSALMTKSISKFEEFPSYETALLFFLAYIGYFVAIALDFSGVISILCSGIVMGHYTWYNLSIEARIVSRAAFQILGELLEAYVFVYVGFSAYSIYGQEISYDFIGLMVVVVLLGRLAGVVIVPGVIKLVLPRFDLKWRELVTVWFAGSIRGAIAFALILTISSDGTKNKQLMITTVLGIVLFTTVVFGSVMPLLKQLIFCLRTPYIEHAKATERLLPISSDKMSVHNDPTSLLVTGKRSKLQKKWRSLDDRFLKSWFIKPKAIAAREAIEAALRKDFNVHEPDHETPFPDIIDLNIQ